MYSKLFISVVVSMCAFGCVEQDFAEPTSQSYELSSAPLICGGIAGFQCPEGMHCLMHDSYPDASGVCVGRAPRVDCSYVRCPMPLCPAGFEAMQTGRSCCSFICRRSQDNDEEGSCQNPSDCEGLIHIMCVGSWSCESNTCSYSCDTSDTEPLEPM